ncbi:Stp1/IreP family PP2C-type Ser/Thr phosphatase [Alloiococcus sp. CFN-8]|uniref:Stp1/IreP family PP2C-type Ser/Thr phosphatase n=1 Tax=Alloiococcus sp. CFN-8 TaxID=3416081 RepID=UPI003CE7792B
MVGYLTDIGNSRPLNEDYINYIEEDNFKLYVIADGMGGHNAGEIASKMAVDSIIDYIKNNIQNCKNGEILISAVKEANEKIYNASLNSLGYNGMGTTVTACIIIGDKTYIANVGDSCCYIVEEDKISKITRDHSLVQELLDEGSITEEEAFHHPNKNIITRAVGTGSNIDVDLFDISHINFNYIIMCTDGLSDELEKEDILRIVHTSTDINEVCRLLINTAKERGGKDNISVLIIGGEK